MRLFRFLALPFAILAELVLLAVCLLMVLLVPAKTEWANALIRAADKLPSWRWYVGE